MAWVYLSEVPWVDKSNFVGSDSGQIRTQCIKLLYSARTIN